MDKIKVVHFIGGGMTHNWEVYIGGCLAGYVHCSNNGEDFGGHVQGLDSFDNEGWDRVQELCHEDLAELYLIDTMEQIGY